MLSTELGTESVYSGEKIYMVSALMVATVDLWIFTLL